MEYRWEPPLVSQASISGWPTPARPVPRWSSQARKSTAARICWRAHDPDASVNVRVRARLRARRSTTQRANGRTSWACSRGTLAEQVIEPGVDVFDQLLPGRQQPGVDQGLADLAAGMAAGEGVEQLVGERPVVAGERGQDAGAVTAAQPGQHAFRVRRAEQRLADRAQVEGGMAGLAEQLVDTLLERAPGAHAAGQAVGRLAAAAAQVLLLVPGAGRADRPARPGRGWSAPGAARSRGRAPGWPAAAGSSARRPHRSPTGR